MENNIYLRAFESEDYKITLKWRQDPELWQNVVGNHHYVSSLTEKKWIEEATNDRCNIKLAICLKENGLHMGNIYLTEIDYINRSANIGILLGEKECRGRGHGTEAVTLIIKYAFFERDLQRLSARIFPDNIASIKLFEKFGFKREGTLRKAIYKAGVRKDLHIYGLLKDDYPQR